MQITCAICAEIFKNADSNNINVTHCGHVFHSECLRKWFERSKTCPECRHKTSTVIKIYCNIVSFSDQAVSEGSEYQNAALQNENDNLKYRLIEKDGEMKSKEAAIAQLTEEKNKMKSSQAKSREIVLRLEREIENFKIFQIENSQEIKSLKSRLKDKDQLKADLDTARAQLISLEAVKGIIMASAEETERLMKERRSADELVTMVVSLKKELEAKREEQKATRRRINELQNQIQKFKEEKTNMEDTISALESKVFHLENSKTLYESPKPLPSKPTILIEDESEANQSKKLITIEKKTKSPFLNIRSSSLAGLSANRLRPSLKRPLSNPSTSEFSIFKNPRLVPTKPKTNLPRPSGAQPE